MKRCGVSSSLKKDSIRRYGERCLKCGTCKNLEFHHILPVYRGGKDAVDNVVPLCRRCHASAPDYLPAFLDYIASRYNPELDHSRESMRVVIKFFYEMSEEQFKEFKRNPPNWFFDTRIEPIFKSVQKLIYGFEDEELENK